MCYIHGHGTQDSGGGLNTVLDVRCYRAHRLAFVIHSIRQPISGAGLRTHCPNRGHRRAVCPWQGGATMSKTNRNNPKRSKASEARCTRFEWDALFPDDAACLDYLMAKLYPE